MGFPQARKDEKEGSTYTFTFIERIAYGNLPADENHAFTVYRKEDTRS